MTDQNKFHRKKMENIFYCSGKSLQNPRRLINYNNRESWSVKRHRLGPRRLYGAFVWQFSGVPHARRMRRRFEYFMLDNLLHDLVRGPRIAPEQAPSDVIAFFMEFAYKNRALFWN